MSNVFKFGELRFWGDPEMEAIAAGCPFETRRCVVTALMIGCVVMHARVARSINRPVVPCCQIEEASQSSYKYPSLARFCSKLQIVLFLSVSTQPNPSLTPPSFSVSQPPSSSSFITPWHRHFIRHHHNEVFLKLGCCADL
jgi:hypothetical protein